MNNYENIMLISDSKNVYACNFSKENIRNKDNVKIIRFINNKLPCQHNELYSKDTNALYVLNKYLQKIDMLSNNEKDTSQVTKIYVSYSLYKKITSGIYKYWITTGYTKSGKELDAREINEWKNFVDAYKKVFTKVKFYSNTLFGAKQFKFNQQEMSYCQAINKKLNTYIKLEQNKMLKNALNNNQ